MKINYKECMKKKCKQCKYYKSCFKKEKKGDINDKERKKNEIR